jgi:hypothetical protein
MTSAPTRSPGDLGDADEHALRQIGQTATFSLLG